jgi:N-methylhydantoinase A/oxoprolinase/acetone carboxylase beta subunit
MKRIGVDVGGTNTDAALLEGDRVRHTVKTPTTPDVTTGVTRALAALLGESRVAPADVGAVMIGTTHFTNAVVQRQGLDRVAAVRIALPAAATLPPFVDWPPDLAGIVRGRVFMLRGGHEVDGRPLAPFDRAGMRAAAREIRAAGLRAAAVTAAFSPLDPACEEEAVRILAEECPEVAVTPSHRIGRLGLLARENVALLNASLVDLARRTTRAFADALAASGVRSPLYLTQNDGTVARAEAALAFPVYSFASGPTNSMRGAAFLSGLKEAIVVDVGGTTSDIGALRHGFPREANNVVHVGGVRTLFRMPDLLSIGLGGGTLVDPQDPIRIGPRSVGYRLTERARVFGGPDLTCTDIAVAAGLVDLGDRSRVASLPAGFVAAALRAMRAMLEDRVDRMKADPAEVPLVAVGGACFLLPERIPGVSSVLQVPHREVANAIGAAIAQVSGEVDQVFQDLSRDAAIAEARRVAEARAVAAGADPKTLETVEVEDLPIAYLPGNSLRVHVRVVGDAAPAPPAG